MLLFLVAGTTNKAIVWFWTIPLSLSKTFHKISLLVEEHHFPANHKSEICGSGTEPCGTPCGQIRFVIFGLTFLNNPQYATPTVCSLFRIAVDFALLAALLRRIWQTAWDSACPAGKLCRFFFFKSTNILSTHQIDQIQHISAIMHIRKAYCRMVVLVTYISPWWLSGEPL